MQLGSYSPVWEKLANLSSDLLFNFDSKGFITHMNDACSSILGFEKEELIGIHYSKFLHQEDVLHFEQAIFEGMRGTSLTHHEAHAIHKNGDIVSLLWSGYWSEADKSFYLVANTKLQSKQNENKPEELGYKTLFNNNPDIIFLENRDGLITKVNPAFSEILGIAKEEVINNSSSSFLPAEMVKVSEMSLREAFLGSTIRYDMEFITKKNERKIFDIIKCPVQLNGKVVAVQTTAKDITPIVRAYETIEHQANKLNRILSSITVPFAMLDRNWIITYINKEAKQLLCWENENNLGKNILDIFPEEIGGTFYSQYVHAFKTGQTVQFTSYLQKLGAWLHVKGFPSEDGLSVYLEDVTEQVRVKQELKRLSLVASNTTNGVLITDKHRKIEWVNKGFTNLTGISFDEAIGKSVAELIFSKFTLPKSFKAVEEKLSNGKSASFELVSSRKEKDDTWLSVQVNPVYSEDGKLERFIAIQTDISERIKAQKELEKLSLVASNTTNGFIITSSDLKIEYVNDGFSRLTGYSYEEAIGKTVFELLDSDKTEPEAYVKAHEKVSHGKPASFEILNRRKDGSEIWLSVQLNPIFGDNGMVERCIALQSDITDIIRTREELEKLSLVASKTNNGVLILDSDWCIEWVNKGFTNLLGYNLFEAVGKRPWELLHGPNTDISEFEAKKSNALQGDPISFDILNYSNKGKEVWLNVEITPVTDQDGHVISYIGIQSDITERIRTRRELEKLSLVASKTNNGVLIADRLWQIEWVNEGFTMLFGYTLEEVIGKPIQEIVVADKAGIDAFYLLQEQLLRGEPISIEIRTTRKDGQTKWFNMDINAVFNEKGEAVQFFVVYTDITSLKNIEQELSDVALDLFKQNRDLQQFTYMVSHNLRAPVAGLLGLGDLMTSLPKDTKEFDTCLTYLRESTEKLDTVIRDMTTILSVRDRKSNMEREKVYLSIAVQEALSFFQDQLHECRGSVSVEVKEDLHVKVNRAYLHSILHNLLSNALKYRSFERDLKIRIKCFDSSHQGAIISFSDNGTGFDMKKAEGKLFQLYKRFHTHQDGRGMGLYLTKTHIEAMGGYIEVSSQENKGTRFLIYLPKN